MINFNKICNNAKLSKWLRELWIQIKELIPKKFFIKIDKMLEIGDVDSVESIIKTRVELISYSKPILKNILIAFEASIEFYKEILKFMCTNLAFTKKQFSDFLLGSDLYDVDYYGGNMRIKAQLLLAIHAIESAVSMSIHIKGCDLINRVEYNRFFVECLLW